MTLITHIWTENLNIISGDGRITNSSTKEIVNDNLKKIFECDNFFIAFHGDCDLENINIPNAINAFLQTYDNRNPKELADDILEHLIGLNPNLKTGLFIGGEYSDATHSIYVKVKDSEITDDKANNKIGFRFNCNNIEHWNELKNCYESAFKATFGRDYENSETYENISNEEFKDFLTLFHECAFKNANPEKGIGPNIDIGIIRNGKFEWIVKNNCA